MQKRFLGTQLRRAMLGGILVAIAASVAPAQPPVEQHYIGLTYIQTLPGKADDFRKFAQSDMTKMGQMGVDEGTIYAYYVMRLTAPYSTSSDYNYIQAVWYKNRPQLAPLDMKVWEARARKAGYSSYQQYVDKRDSLAKTVRNAWRLSVARLGEINVGNYMRSVAYQVEPDYRPEMARFLREYTALIAQSNISDGRYQGWGASRPAPVTGSDDEAGMSYSVSTIWKDSATLMNGPATLSEERFQKAVPGKQYAAYLNDLNRLNAHRKAVSTRIYEVVSMAGAPPKVAP